MRVRATNNDDDDDDDPIKRARSSARMLLLAEHFMDSNEKIKHVRPRVVLHSSDAWQWQCGRRSGVIGMWTFSAEHREARCPDK